MGSIVLGIGTSHSPLLAIAPELWAERGKDDLRRKDLVLSDGRVVSYEEKLRDAGDRFRQDAQPERFVEQAAQAQADLDRLAAAIADVDPDVLVIVGDDQEELFSRMHMPAIALFTGPAIDMHPRNEVHPDLPEWFKVANKGYRMDTGGRHSGAPELAGALVDGMIADGVDLSIATMVADPRVAGFGHAYGFVFERLLNGRNTPTVPVMLNTYYPPNVPTAARCYAIGKAMRRAVEAFPRDCRVAVVASGGLTHFATDEAFDRAVLDALADKDEAAIAALPTAALRSGNSEILNWICAAGALEHLSLDWRDYIPVHRTSAGTGIGLGFAIWR